MTHAARTLAIALIAAAAMVAAGCQPTPQPRNDRYDRPPVKPAQPEQGTRTVPPPKPVNDKVVAGRFQSLLRATSDKVAASSDMRCRLVRREMVNNVLQPEEQIDFRQRFSPHSLRLIWTGPRFKERDLIFVSGANDDMVLVREKRGLGGLFTGGRTLRFALNHPTITGGSRYAPNVAGYNNLIRRLSQIYNGARPLGLAWVVEQPADAGVRRLQTFDVALEPALLGGDVSRMVVTFDAATSLAVRSIVYDAKGVLVEDYDWQDLRLNAGLADADFTFGNGR